jgi:hypothetical protein
MSAATSPPLTLNRMSAEIIFSNSADVNPTIAELVELDFDVEILEDCIDDCGPAVWILASAITELNPAAFFDRVKTIVEPLGGWVVEAGYAARWRGRHLVESVDTQVTQLL